MVPLIVILTIIVFILVDLALRLLTKQYREAKAKRERAKVLDTALRLDYTDEAKSLKRVEVKDPRAKILAVDDEAIVLDSFRKILVLAGYAVDTVESGKEAIGLVRKREYDFVFTDLKMPEMDGLEVTKAVKHFQPEIDVIMITGFGTIESAVDAMKFGAMDYVQKPFTEDELVEFVNAALIRRQDRIERQMRPNVHLVTPTVRESPSVHEFNVPAGVFIAHSHTWARIELNGMARIGIDDFVQKSIGSIDEVEPPHRGDHVDKGDALFSIRQGSRRMSFPSPLSGRVDAVNAQLLDRPELIKMRTYESGWICCIAPTNLSADLHSLKIGADAVAWYQEEIDKLVEMKKKISSQIQEAESQAPISVDTKVEGMSDRVWDAFSKAFLLPG